MRHIGSVAIALVVALCAWQPATASQVTYHPAIPGLEPGWAEYVFDFTAVPPGAGTPVSETVGDLTVTYVAPDDPLAFKVVDGAGIPASPSPLPWLLGAPGSPALGIDFDRAVFGVAVRFLTLGDGPMEMDVLSGGLAGTVVGNTTAGGTVPPGLIHPEGFIGLLPVCVCDNTRDALWLRDPTDQGFAVQQIVVLRQIPEPSTLALLVIAFAWLPALRGRQVT